jgi:hypothetical protein
MAKSRGKQVTVTDLNPCRHREAAQCRGNTCITCGRVSLWCTDCDKILCHEFPYSVEVYGLAQKNLTIQNLYDLLEEKCVTVTETLASDKRPDVIYANLMATNKEKVKEFFDNINTSPQPGEVLSRHIPKEDPVNHPSHYNQFPVEIIEICRHLNFDRGNAVKYICRAGFKNPEKELEDLEKARWYLEDEIDRLKDSACERFHPGEKCIPGDNHPSVDG